MSQVNPGPEHPQDVRATESHALPPMTWEMVSDVLQDLVAGYPKAGLVPIMVSAQRKQSTFLPPDEILRQIFIMATVLQDESFQP
jgi:hypothetical protein